MANITTVEEQLKRIGCNFRFWGRWEVKELANVLLPGETIEHCVNGIYEGGFAMLAATDQRILLIDKKPMYLTLEDVRFDMISELDYNHRLLNSALKICTPNKALFFKSYNGDRLRHLFHFTQHKVMEIRQYFNHQAEDQKPSPLAFNHTTMQGAANMPQATPGSTYQTHQPLATDQSPHLDSRQGSSAFKPIFDDSSQQNGQYSYQQVGVSGAKKVVPIISAYTRLPLMSRHRRYPGLIN